MAFDPHLAEHRFGYGRAPGVAAPSSVTAMLEALGGPDKAQLSFPLPKFRDLQDMHVVRRRFRDYARKFPDTQTGKDASEKERGLLRESREQHDQWFTRVLARRATTQDAFRERLVTFWADHFTAIGKVGIIRVAAPLYVEEAVRPHVTGRFADLLEACVTHPIMLHYLDQEASVGPNSRFARRRQDRRGLNENLAREVLELHTIGVDGPYTQTDVRELAELFTGLTRTRDYSFKFRNQFAEPGAETVLGRTYGATPGVASVRAVLRDLAHHPATARHIARKLVVHFVADTPPQDLIQAVETAYLGSDGDLMACYDALLHHPLAWSTPATNIRPPDEFLSAAVRSLGVPSATLTALDRRDIRRLFLRPLNLMGQPWLRPNGPDGFDEADKAWVTPQGIAARLEWAMTVPARLLETLPDPREFVHVALGDTVPERVAFAASAAEERGVALGLVLTSPAFQRR